jgi:hypothetical protein
MCEWRARIGVRSLEPILMPRLDIDYYYYGTAGGRKFWVRPNYRSLPIGN